LIVNELVRPEAGRVAARWAEIKAQQASLKLFLLKF